MIGGMSWESSAEYYRLLNTQVNNELGGLHSAKCILYSLDFEEIEHYQRESEWEKASNILISAAISLEVAGADFILICTNTMHKVYEQVATKIKIPIIHLADTTADRIIKRGISTIGLLGTKYTMEQEFYTSHLINKGIDVIVPEGEERDFVNDVIYRELCMGQTNSTSKEMYISIMQKMKDKGAQGIILGCTEITLLVKQEDISIPLFDTTRIHAEEAVRIALS